MTNNKVVKAKSVNNIRTELGYEVPLLRAKDLPTRLTEKPKNDEVRRFELVTAEMNALHARKNRDYGGSFEKSLDDDGLLVAKIRLMDKMNRYSQLIKNPAEVTDESLRDTLIDLAVYAAKTVAWMDVNEPEQISGSLIYADGELVEVADNE